MHRSIEERMFMTRCRQILQAWWVVPEARTSVHQGAFKNKGNVMAEWAILGGQSWVHNQHTKKLQSCDSGDALALLPGDHADQDNILLLTGQERGLAAGIAGPSQLSEVVRNGRNWYGG